MSLCGSACLPYHSLFSSDAGGLQGRYPETIPDDLFVFSGRLVFLERCRDGKKMTKRFYETRI